MTIKITTLMEAELTNATLTYTFPQSQSNPSFFTLKITTSTPHGIFGEVKVQLSNVKVFNVNGINDFFNSQILTFFSKKDNLTELFYEGSWSNFSSQSFLVSTVSNLPMPNSGVGITINVNNAEYSITDLQNIAFYIDESKSNAIGANVNNRVTFNTIEYNAIDDVFYSTSADYNDIDKRTKLVLFDNKFKFFITDFTFETKIILKIFA